MNISWHVFVGTRNHIKKKIGHGLIGSPQTFFFLESEQKDNFVWNFVLFL